MGTMIILSYKGSATSGNRGHAGRPGKVGGSAPKSKLSGAVLESGVPKVSVDEAMDMVQWSEFGGTSTVLRGGALPDKGPIFLSGDAEIALAYGEGRGTGVYDIDMNKIAVTSSEDFEKMFNDDQLEEIEYAGIDLFSDPPKWFIPTLKRHGYIGYGTSSGSMVRIEQEGKDHIKHVATVSSKAMKTIILGVKGSATSGNRMHAGRPGKIGGSMPRNFGAAQQAFSDIMNYSPYANQMTGIDLSTLNRVGLQAIIDFNQGNIDYQQMFNIVTAPTSARASGTYTSAAATAARAAAGPTSDLTEDIDWTTTGLAVPNRSGSGTPWVSNAEDAWILGIDKTNQAGKQAIADYTAGYITKETLHERLSPAYRDMNLGFAIPGIENTARDQGKTDFNDLFAAKINGTAQRRSFTKDEAWVSQIKLSELNDNQWKAFSEYKRGLITLDDLRKTVAPHTLLPTAPPPKAPKIAKAPNDKTQPAKYYDPDDLPSMKGFSNGSMYISSSAKNGGDGYLDAIVKDQGFDGKPQVITRAQFDAAVAAGEVAIYRGTSSSAASRVQRYKDFRTGEYYSGFGMYGHGTYASTVQSTARSYDGGEHDQSSRILAMTIKPDAKVIEYSDASIQKGQYVAKQWRNNSMIADDDGSIGRWAAAAGYDAIRVPNADRNNGDFYVILNRTAVRVVNVDFSIKDDTTF